MFSPDDILARYRCREGKDVFFLGVQERRLAIINQQVRAFNLAYSIAQYKPHSPVAIVGAGIGGLTFAAACVLQGLRVCVFEEHSRPIPMQHKSPREISPYILEWPSDRSIENDTDLPWMNWTAGPASQARLRMLFQYDALRKSSKYKTGFIGLHPGRVFQQMKVGEVRESNQRFTIVNSASLLKQGAEQAEDIPSSFDCVVICTGFGAERSIKAIRQHSLSYWDENRLSPLSLVDGKPVLVSGVGDGGLIEALTIATDCSGIRDVIGRVWPTTGGLPPRDVHDAVRKVERSWQNWMGKRQNRMEDEAAIHYHTLISAEQAVADLVSHFRRMFNAAPQGNPFVHLIGPLQFPYTAKSSALNRLLTYLAVQVGLINYSQRPKDVLSGGKCIKDRRTYYTVTFPKNVVPVDYSYVLPRHGPVPRAGEHSQYLGWTMPDPTNVPDCEEQMWPSNQFTVDDDVRLAVQQLSTSFPSTSSMRIPPGQVGG
jgi:hypothetical protein